ncbi:MAG TPA: hypothetical protein VEG24_09575 [Gaiellaceae bacterium]|nr:hypothetical protein [Gaiellaceae bacterium]
MRRSLAWLVAVPLMLGGSQLAHALAYRIAYPQAHVRVVRLLATGHAYLAWLPLALGVASACVLVALACTALDAARGRAAHALPAPAFALLPPVAFALQEVLELSLHTGTFAWRAVLAPTFVPGVLLQLPVAALVYAAARLLLRAAERVGRALARPRFTLRPAALRAPVVALVEGLLAPSVRLARAPPLAVVS